MIGQHLLQTNKAQANRSGLRAADCGHQSVGPESSCGRQSVGPDLTVWLGRYTGRNICVLQKFRDSGGCLLGRKESILPLGQQRTSQTILTITKIILKYTNTYKTK
jgi:hypothetical protein